MQFGTLQKLKFDTQIGSYSIVTEREHYDSQITATDSEAELLVSFFGRKNIHVGNVASDPQQSRKTFKLYPSGEEIGLNLVFPKPNKTELRLYLSSRAGFKPHADSVWFMFVDEDALWIGNMPEDQWRYETNAIVSDETETVYQESLSESDTIKIHTLQTRDVFSRSRELALARIAIENFRCEYDPNHNLFNSRHTQRPYLEAHHLIPMALQKTAPSKLDVIENIFSLCPFCHRAIHHADKPLTRNIISRLIEKRPGIFNVMNVTVTDIFSFYGVEDIC